jgi:hypothetical protein
MQQLSCSDETRQRATCISICTLPHIEGIFAMTLKTAGNKSFLPVLPVQIRVPGIGRF